eukprot:SAG11_NODE_4862_length_1743_cov_2.052920_1_plen_79_part_10
MRQVAKTEQLIADLNPGQAEARATLTETRDQQQLELQQLTEAAEAMDKLAVGIQTSQKVAAPAQKVAAQPQQQHAAPSQ